MADLQIFQLPAKATPALADKIPIQDASGTDGAKSISLNQVKLLVQDVKRFVGALVLNGAGVPTVSTALNTLGGNFTFTKNGTGDYTATCSVAAFPTAYKVIVNPFTQVVEFGTLQVFIFVATSTTLRIYVKQTSSTNFVDATVTDGINFDISVYP